MTDEAEQNDKLDVMEMLIEMVPELCEYSIHWAAKNGHLKLVKKMIENGASPNARHRWIIGWTPLIVACQHNRGDIVSYLVCECKVDVNENSPLMTTVKNETIDCMRILLDNGAIITSEILLSTIKNCSLPVLKLLCESDISALVNAFYK